MKPGIPPCMLPEEREGPQSQGGDRLGEESRNLNSGVDGVGKGALSTAGLPSRDGKGGAAGLPGFLGHGARRMGCGHQPEKVASEPSVGFLLS